jgi:hypothetical protein
MSMFFAFPAFAAPLGNQDRDTEQAISYLMSAVGNSHYTFIRNGEKHSSEEAVKHMKEKCEYFKSKIKTPEDFIRLCASRSLLSGSPYLVEAPQGVMPTEDWLMQVLAKYREGH